MRITPAIAVSATLLLALSGCSSPIDANSETRTSSAVPTPFANPSATGSAIECPPLPIDVVITYELSSDANGGISINATSNLPDGAELASSFFIENEFLAQDNGVLDGGRVTFGPFSDKGTPLQGTYDMSITLPIARNQPDEIQACIGKAGEHLTGPLVSAEELTGDNFASVDARVTVG